MSDKRHLDLDRAAIILAEAIILGDKVVAKKYGITTVTIRSYRMRSHTDAELLQNLQRKKELLFAGWHDELQDAIMAGINFIKRAAQEADPKDAAIIHSVAGATNLLLETQLRKEVIDARFRAVTVGDESRTPNLLLDSIPSHIEE